MSLNMSRRKFVASLTATAGGLSAVGATAQARFFQPPSDYNSDFHNGAVDTNAYARTILEKTKVLESTGIPDLDKFLDMESKLLSTAYEITVDLLVIDDPTPNAFAMNRSYSGKSKGSVLIGRNLAQQQILSGRSGLYSLVGIMAHEWAHILQYNANLKQSVKERELHADYMSGWYLAQKGQMGGMVDFQTFSSTLYSRGDYSFDDHMHHGTPAERVNAMLAGVKDVMKGQTLSIDVAFDMGLKRVRSGYLS